MIPSFRLAAAFCLPLLALTQTSPQTSALLKKLEGIESCAGCETLLVQLKGTALLGDTAFIDAVAGVCKLARAEDSDVCEGIAEAEGPVLAHALRAMSLPSHTSQLFCTAVLGRCDIPNVRPYNVTFPKPEPEATRPPPSGKKPLQFVHFSDIHVDHKYETGSNSNCSKPLCCRSYTPEDAPGNNSYPAGPNGDHMCDSPRSLEESMYHAIEAFAPNASFALFTGDIPDHAVWSIEKEDVKYSLRNAYDTMASILTIPVYGTVGNHEAAPTNSFPSHATVDPISSQWVYSILSKAWRKWLNNDSITASDYGAYAHHVPGTNLKVISVNTNLWYKLNLWVYEDTMQFDPNSQLAWLVSELQASEDVGERVYILGHMPPGVDDALRDSSNYFNQIVNRYDATIAAMWWGHTHKDHFEITYDDYENQRAEGARMVGFVAPSLTPTSGSPAFQVITVDPETFGVLDIETYAASLEHPEYQKSGPVWERQYSTKESYGPYLGVSGNGEELTPAFWHNLTEVFERDDEVFQAYFARKTRGWNVSPCVDECKKDEICQLRAAEAQYNCIKPAPRRFVMEMESGSREKQNDGEDCHGVSTGSILKEIADRHVKRGYKQDL
ncbi:Sphingomyelin phosphodiesterase [Fulvia fulva]|uniref:Sphingomyelin phosphodiesterase n=1 Tax=Passalora fulva TaxID=5499 RepID=A0A9Q8UVS0_PASFU|nr:Sphingomyelin phosphodiesterase [Fulvia fulva]KAK4610259.1 Sphingomyelin phosphodiesterase [Fulvia fulva]KAK4611045.1 Sphingomyelin phosphodiesterase [Fulvia fulva]UJO24162.1 Sphingomyelin phosphodiesterase [Fulvia fulva]WPV22402.1 Sphingomyelin phosphodiesterase [Fulvia fulva]WPV37220.1 Sphingomyelin phosphodiesterase [Fulvia fulva]